MDWLINLAKDLECSRTSIKMCYRWNRRSEPGTMRKLYTDR